MKRPKGISDYDWDCKKAAIHENKRRKAKAERERIKAKAAKARREAERKKHKDLCDIVYLVGWRPEGPIKIGITDNEKSRLQSLQTGCPYKLSIMKSFPCKDRRQSKMLERWAHERLGALRMEGEWFDLSIDEATESLQTLKKALDT